MLFELVVFLMTTVSLISQNEHITVYFNEQIS